MRYAIGAGHFFMRSGTQSGVMEGKVFLEQPRLINAQQGINGDIP
jgi:hypothetical protein